MARSFREELRRKEPAMRGFICRAAFTWAAERFGKESVLALAEQIPEDIDQLGVDLTRDGSGFLDSVWYPAEPLKRVLPTIMSEFSHEEQLVFAEEAGRYVFDKQLRGLQRALLGLMMSPKRYIKYASKAWLHNFSDGVLTFESGDEGGRAWHRCTYTEWSAHDPLICRMMVSGKLLIYAAMGCKEVELEVEGCDPQGAGCSSRVSWKSKSTEALDAQ
jgi:hypothetical protein